MDPEADGKEMNEGCSTTENHISLFTMETTKQSELEVAVAPSPEQWMDLDANDERAYTVIDTTDSLEKNTFEFDKSELSETKLDCPENEPGFFPIKPDCSENVHGCFAVEPDCSEKEPDYSKIETSCYENELGCSINEPDISASETDCSNNELGCSESEPDCPNNKLGCFESEHGCSEIEPGCLDDKPEYSENKPDCSENSFCTEIPFQDQDEGIMLEGGLDKFNRNESITSSVSDTLSSADSVYENEVLRKKHGTTELDSELEQVPEQEKYPELGQCPEPEQDPEPEKYHETEYEPDPDLYLDPDEDTALGLYLKPEPDYEPDQYPESEQTHELELYNESKLESVDNEPELKDEIYQTLAIDTEESRGAKLFEPPNTEESIFQQALLSSDLDPDEIDDCLTVEIDSEIDEKWRTIFSSSINKEDDDSYLDSLQLSAQELFVQKVEVTDFDEQDNNNNIQDVHFEIPKDEVPEKNEDIISNPSQSTTYNHLSLQSLCKASEDDSLNERETSQSHNTNKQHNSDLNKKLPKDFCVIQENKSKNVSTEHVDFQLARKQWRELEKQTNNKVVLPTTKQSSLCGSHSFMYTPVRNIERGKKKAHDLETLNLLGDYLYTQFSPCSEDSGLDDSSFRSTYDDTETPGEREIRISLEGEESFRRQRSFSRMGKSTDCTPSRSIPRSISTPLTPSFIITSSPTKEPLKHEMLANNVIILDHSHDVDSCPRQGNGNTASRSSEWHSEDNSNIIILETSNLIIRSASDFSLNKAYDQPQEKMFLNNPFFKLRSRSTISLVDEEIKMVQQREEELRKERANLYGKDGFNKERLLSNHMDTLAFAHSDDVPVKCKSSPSSPMKTGNRMDRSALSCDHRFPEAFTGGIRKSALALRWEAGEFTQND